MTDTVSTRITGVVTLATGVLAIALLLNHPAEYATDFPGFLKEEAANRTLNAIVHGGFLLLLPIQIVCYAVLSRTLGFARVLSIAGIVFFTTGAAIQIADLVVDGLMIPAMAQRYLLAPPDQLTGARALFSLCETAIRILMPLGLGFQAAAVIAWGMSMMHEARGNGLLAVAFGLLAFSANAAAATTGAQHLSLVAIVFLELWATATGVFLMRRGGVKSPF
jgi:hypothetical protein